MKNIKTLIVIILIGLSACVNEPREKSLIIKTGTSFGFCIGYCSLEVMITENNVEYIKRSRDKDNYPPKVLNLLLSNSEWEDLIEIINMDEFEKLDDVIGCPDCTDGGSEWIEIILKQKRKKVTFEYGDSLKETNKLLEKLRGIRNRYYNQRNVAHQIISNQNFSYGKNTYLNNRDEKSKYIISLNLNYTKSSFNNDSFWARIKMKFKESLALSKYILTH